jgi:heat shock protein HslJ/uncharacterized membrane protein
MDVRTLAIFVLAALAASACERSDKAQPAPLPEATAPPATESASADVGPSFVNKVWEVAQSKQVERGSLRVFLADGTLVMASPNAKPAFGSWRYVDGRLTIIEEGHEYPAEILALGESAFRIRMLSPGEPVEILFAQAKPVAPDSIAAAARTNVAVVAEAEPQAAALWGTAWRLEDLAGSGVMDRVQATLEFPSEGLASGNGSCNRFNGVVNFEGNAIRFGGLAATRKACTEAVMRQEEAYFAALGDAERYEADGQSLKIHVLNRAAPLRFTAMEPTSQPTRTAIERAPATASTALMGVWTVTAHHAPGVGATSDEAARARLGESVRLTRGLAASSGQRCDDPRYASSRVPTQPFLASQYNLPTGSLKPLARQGEVQVLEVSCGGARWTALGATLLEIDADRVLAPWNGVFYELTRDRDFRALGQEPGWQLEIRKGAEIRFTYDYGKGTAITPEPKAQLDASTGTRSYHAVTEANDLSIEIVPVRCEDSMSGQPFPATVSVTLNGRSFRGCGGEIATPYQG